MTAPPRPMFALVREDPAVELSLVAKSGARRLVVIGSGGCTALSLLSDDVDDVCVVDASPAQTALVLLRAAAIGLLDRTGYLRFIGALPDTTRLDTWQRLRSGLPSEVVAYWDALPEAIGAGVDSCGVTEGFYRFVGQSLRRSDWPDAVWRGLLEAGSLDEQRAILARHFADARFRIALEMLLSRSTHELFYPSALFANVAEHDFAARFTQRFHDYASRVRLRGNYFVSQLLFGRYLLGEPGGVPPYLAESQYPVVRRNLHKLHVVTGKIEDVVGPSSRGDAFFLSNVLDWADPKRAELIGARVRAAARPEAVVLLRHLLGRPGLPSSLGARRDTATESEALSAERSFLYGAISIGWLGGVGAGGGE
jgi:S-adenosylmethionine-diacylglycerol 3-amino-3-carboxypropyl transferase